MLLAEDFMENFGSLGDVRDVDRKNHVKDEEDGSPGEIKERDWFVDEEYEERVNELLTDEVAGFVKSLSVEGLERGDQAEEERFGRILKLAEEVGGRIVKELMEIEDDDLLCPTGKAREVTEKAGAFLDVFGGLVRRLSDRRLFDHAVNLNARIPWMTSYEFADPGGPYEFTLTCDYTREANWKDMVSISPIKAYEAAARNMALLSEYDVATIVYELYVEGEEELAGKLMPLDEAEEKWFELKNMLSSVHERWMLPGRRIK
ncbi:MAG: hypothetical protein QXZ14_09175 [Candidatus Jordarchaeales archaeon]